MTVFHFDDSHSVASTPQKHNSPIEELHLWLTGGYKQFKSETRSSVSSDSDVFSAEDSDDSEKADDVWDEEMLGDPKLGSGLLHDHCYTKRKAEKRVPSVFSSECSSETDESLQHLFDTCDIDRDFLAGATLAHGHFLEDVLDIGDIPADDFFLFDFDEISTSAAGCLSSTKTSSLSCLTISSCLPSSPSASPSPCIFTSAGSTDTVLSTSVAGFTSYNTHRTLSSSPSPLTPCCVSAASLQASAAVSKESPCVQVPLFDFSSSFSSSLLSSTPSSTSASFSSDFPVTDLVADSSFSPDSSSLDSKLKDVIDFLFSPSSATPEESAVTSPNVTSFLEEMDSVRCAAVANKTRQPLLSFSDSEDSVWPVTLSHRIQNGACVNCCLRRQSATSTSGDHESLKANFESSPQNNDDSDTTLACPSSPVNEIETAAATLLQQQQQQQHCDSDSSTTPVLPSRCGKRKSCDTTDSEDCSLYSPVCGKQARLGGASSGDEDCSEADRDAVFSPSPSFLPALPAPTSVVPDHFHAPMLDAENAECNDLVSSAVSSRENVEGVAKKRSAAKVFDFLSAFGGSDTKLPLSPINVNHFGRCG